MDEIIYSNLNTKQQPCAAGVNDQCGCYYLRCIFNVIPGQGVTGYFWQVVNIGNPYCVNPTIYGSPCTPSDTCGCVNYPDDLDPFLCEASQEGTTIAYACPSAQ